MFNLFRKYWNLSPPLPRARIKTADRRVVQMRERRVQDHLRHLRDQVDRRVQGHLRYLNNQIEAIDPFLSGN
jgi:predicted Zn-dependent protease